MNVFRLPVVLLVILCIVIAIAWWDEDLVNKDYIFHLQQKKFFTLSANQVDKIVLSRDSEGGMSETLSFRKDIDDLWRMEPEGWFAEKGGIEELLKNLLNYKFQKKVEEGSSRLSEFGLEKPRIEISLVSEAKKQTYRLKIGRDSPVGHGIYTMMENDDVYVSSRFILLPLKKTRFEFQEKRLLAFIKSKVEKVVVARESTIVFTPEMGNWYASPDSHRIEKKFISDFIESLFSLTAIATVQVDRLLIGSSNFSLLATIEVHSEGNEVEDLHFLKDQNNHLILHLPRRGVMARVSSDYEEKLKVF